VIEKHGQHLIVDIYQAENINDINVIKNAIHEMIHELNATLLSENYHYFEPHGVTGVACLAESHISCHTWPEDNYAAFDVFVCGEVSPEVTLNIFKKYFSGQLKSQLIKR